MRSANFNFLGVGNYGSNFTMSIGVVKNNADLAQEGRLQVYIPSVDSPSFVVEDLPWALYVSPYGGTTANFKVGREQDEVPGASTYGFWAIPKNGAQVICGYLEGDPTVRFWLGCTYMPELNRTLPQSINEPPISTEIDESGAYPQQEIPHYRENLDEAGLGPDDDHFKTRGGYERSVSHPSNKNRDKPRDDGYYDKPLETERADSQTICLTSPGRHFMSMHDLDVYCRMRFKTTAGNQIILDDTNERIYISTAKGRNWIEIDEGSGKIYFYTASKFSIHSENDLNLYSDQNINIVAKKRVNIQSEERAVKIQAKLNVEALSTGANIKLTASRDLHLKTVDGDQADAVDESSSCVLPPYSDGPLGLVRDYAEEGGSSSSAIFINASDNVEVRSDHNTVNVTGKNDLNLRAMDGEARLSSSGTVQIKSSSDDVSIEANNNLNRRAKLERNDIPHSVDDFDGDVATADAASEGSDTSGETIKEKMVVPLHESWTRDEDEDDCKTPRNDNYQG